jgi:hypothetical protein
MKKRGDIAFVYGGSPSHFSSTAEVLDMPVDVWMKGLDGFVRWLTTAPGKDPWFNSDGSGTAMFFPGGRFGLDRPLPSIRLKIQRNCLQDIALLRQIEARSDPDEVRRQVASMAGNARPEDWWNGNAAMKKLPPWEWSNASYREAAKPTVREAYQLDGRWWLSVRDYAFQQARQFSGSGNKLQSRRPTTARPGFEPFRPADRLNSLVPKQKLYGSVEDQLTQLAAICTKVVDGDRCWRIVTDRAEDWLFRKLPGDAWAGMDNYDVDLDEFRSLKKDLIRLSNLPTVLTDCNLWMRVRNSPDQVHMVIRQAKDWSLGYRFRQMAITPTPEMKRALAGELAMLSDLEEGMISMLTPVRNSKGDVVGFIEICHGEEVVVVTQ